MRLGRAVRHVYQDRYKSLPVLNLLHYFTLIRYIEANPINSRLVKRAEDWRWSSLSERVSGRLRIVEEGPWPLPSDWPAIVNTVAPAPWAPLEPVRPQPPNPFTSIAPSVT